MKIEIKPAYEERETIINLFTEYTEMLYEVRSDIGDYLDLQNYHHELEHLEEKYGHPDGRLYIAYADNNAAGCIGLRKLNETECEMKRLFIRPEYRNLGIAHQLAEKIINEARQIGYQSMLLDSLPELIPALKFYEKLGFYRIPAYNDSPVTNTVFMKIDLFRP
ncbi:MAG: GNAT family N-acetyltransferase [Lachnospiraceae bacterium]|nr:GNAT family N-acetyltransferase [Lachnospiraceae bacterium]